jgi:hypothetical protein
MSDPRIDAAIKLSGNNPGAASVLAQIIKCEADPNPFFNDLNTLGLTGPKIWVAYKYHCEADLGAFMAAVRAHDASMLATVERMMR